MHRRRAGWRPARFFRWVALAAILVLLSGVGGGIALVWTIAARLGIVSASSSPAGVLVVIGGAMVGALCTAALILTGGMRLFGRPLAAVMEAANRVADGDYSVRVNEEGGPPLRALARAFNTMTGRLAAHDRLRRDLMADVAHELRTPLTVIQGKLEGVIDGVYPRGDRELTEVLDETRLLARLVEDLRTLALTEAGALTLEREPTDLVALIRDVVRSLDADARTRGVTVTITAGGIPDTVDVDPIRIREVLANLLTNAIRHTPAGGAVTMEARRSGERIELTVADAGEGMSADEVAHAFERFHKGRGSRGSGLGLTIARNLVEAHGGQIQLASELGRGTTATISLPVTFR